MKNLASLERGRASNKEHKMIMEAIKEKDADKAERLANEHIINAYQNMKNNGFEETIE